MDIVKPEDLSPALRAIIAVGLMFSVGIQYLDTTIAAVALTHMKGSLSATQDQISWVVTAQLATSAVCLPLTGWVSMKLGRKRLFMFAVGGFTLASMAAANATSLTEIVAIKIFQGVAGASLIPLSQACMLDIFPREQRNRAMSLWGIATAVGPVVGPPLGGYMTEEISWRFAFYASTLPLGTCAFFIVTFFLPNYGMDKSKRFDLFGYATLAICVASFQILIDSGERMGWFGAWQIWLFAGASVAALYLFAIHCAFARDPFLNPALLKDRNYAMGTLVVFFVGFMQFTAVVVMPAFVQQVLGYSVSAAGWAIVPRGIGMFLSMTLAGMLVNRMSPRAMMIAGFLVMASGSYAMAVTPGEMPYWYLLASSFFQGLGVGFIFVPLGVIAYATLEPRLRPEGTSFFNLLRGIGTSLGVAILMAVLSQSIQVNHEVLTQYASHFHDAIRYPDIVGAYGIERTADLARLEQTIAKQALIIAYQNVFLVMVAVPLAGIPIVLLLKSVAPAAQPAE